MTVARIGRYTTSHTTFVADISGEQRAYVADPSSQTIIVYRLGAYIGYQLGGSAAPFRLGIGATSGTAPDPSTLLASTSQLSASAVMDESSGGAVVTGTLPTPLLCPPGTYAFVVACTGSAFINELTAAEISSQNEQFYSKSTSTTTITNPIGGSAAVEGHMGIWAEGDVNVAPNTPTNLSPSGVQVGGNFQPVMWGDFVDANQTLSSGQAWDYIAASQIQVVRQSDSHIMWDHTEGSGPTQQSESKTQITYNGEALAANVTYTYKLRQQDRAGAWSPWTSTTFSIAPAGSVNLPTAPAGKQLTQTPGPFTAVWTHQTGLSTSHVQVQLTQNGMVVATSPSIAQTVAPNGTISVTWAQTGFSPLAWGQSFYAQIAGQDTNGTWSQWSDGIGFSTDAAPSVPSSLSPSSGAVVTAYPLLSCVVSDADNTVGSLTVKAELFNASGTLLFTRTMTYNSTTGRYQYQTTSTDFASYATYRWDAYAGDGTLWSGKVTTEASATRSVMATVVYAQGPVITGQSPADGVTITASNPTFSWTVTDQQKLRVQVWAVNGDGTTGAQVYDSGTVTSTTASWPMPPHILRNGTTYEWTVTITNSAPLSGTSTPIRFTLTMTPPTGVSAFTADAVRIATDATETGVLLTWAQTTYASSVWEAYDVWRQPLGPDGVTPVGTALWLRHLTNPLQTAFLDGEPVSGILYQYSITQTIRDDLDDLTSDPAIQQAGVAFDGVILSNVLDPETYHVDLRYGAGSDEGKLSFAQDLVVEQPFGATLGRATRGAYQAWHPSGDFALITDNGATAQARFNALQALANVGGTICYRDGRGTIAYVVLTNADITYQRIMRYDVSLSFAQIQWVGGETGVTA